MGDGRWDEFETLSFSIQPFGFFYLLSPISDQPMILLYFPSTLFQAAICADLEAKRDSG